jgi:protoporphyrinogen/coproporphyrinogen III oxidase
MKNGIAVVGAGIAGLTCAYELQRMGLPVRVYEREKTVGGRMRTRTTDRLSFDLGANFLIRAYSRLLRLADELGVVVKTLSPVTHVVYRAGKFHTMNFNTLRDVIRMEGLNIWNRFKFLEFVVRLRAEGSKLDFFELSGTPDEMNNEDAYSFAKREIGQDFADYILDSFHACMMFYRAEESSAVAFRSFFSMKVDPDVDFEVLHSTGEMQGIPSALSRSLDILTDCPVVSLEACDQGWRVETASGSENYRILVLATTANVAKCLLKNGPPKHMELLAATRYACTVNLSYRVARGVLDPHHCYYIPYVENQVVAEFTNESLKGDHTTPGSTSLVNVGLHESACAHLMELSDQELFSTVAAELARIHPGLTQLTAHDLQRWPQAIPKYDCEHITRVKQFLNTAQGQDGLYLCGDYMNAPWLEGACRSGWSVARDLVTQCAEVGQ